MFKIFIRRPVLSIVVSLVIHCLYWNSVAFKSTYNAVSIHLSS